MLTCPKPDLYLSLPIIERKRVVKRDRNRDYVYNFFLDELQIMENENGLVSCPLNALGEGDVDERYRLCFPGFVLEAKHHLVTQSNRIKAYCQAANASANALALLHNLITGSYANDPTDDDRPVVAMTLVGHKARLWLAGITSERKKLETFKTPGRRKTRRRYIRVKYHMQCVWKGDLHYEDEMTQLVCIIEELEQWMISDFRPFVSDRIALYEDADQWGALEDEETDTEESEGEGESNTDSDEQTDEDEDSDENWSPTGTDDESESGLDSDDEDLSEYERDIDRIDSLMDKVRASRLVFVTFHI
ncbi:hypothetical protein BJX63DRAFT_132709 [Aspergillus granulosus]|uniref:Uncharacterized protein n=1 Tax=Aspergillus granulosus TaxID=176169 RepID=A0ABR4HNC4_9EURO